MNRQRSIFRLLFSIAIPISLLLPSGSIAAPSTDGIVQSACELDYPPFSMVRADGSADGFSVELLRAALRKMGRQVEFKTGPWAEVRGLLERGEIDVLPLVGRTPEREPLFDFTVPYLTMRGALVVRTETTGVHSLADLKGRRVAVMKGDNAEEFLRREERDFEIVTAPTYTDAIRKVARGDCDAVLIQRLVGIRLLQKADLENITILDQPINEFSQDFCFAVREGDKEMLSILNEGLALTMADGTHRGLHAKWFAHLQLPNDRPIIVGGDHDFPPFEFLDAKGRPAGYNVDLIRAVAEAEGLNIEIRLGPWPKMMQAVKAGEVDAMQGMFYSPARDQNFDFSQPHLISHCVAVVRADGGSAPQSPEELKDKRIVVQNGDIMHDFAVEHGLEEVLTTVNTQEDALRSLVEGEQDCALVTRMTALYWIERRGWDGLVVGREPLLSPQYCFAVPSGRSGLLSKLSEGLNIIAHTGEYRDIHQRWLGIYEPGDAGLGEILKYVAMIGGPLLLIAVLAMLWTSILHRQVARQTRELKIGAARLLRAQYVGHIGDWEFELDTKIVNTSEEARRIYGLDSGTLTIPEVQAIPLSEYRPMLDAALEGLVERGEDYDIEFRIRRPADNEIVDIRSIAEYDPDTRTVFGIIQDITDRKRAAARIEHLNQVLRAIRDVNQLITHEPDRETLLRRSCEIIISTRGYLTALIALKNEEGKLRGADEAGIENDFAAFREAVKNGLVPKCYQKAADHPDGIAVMHNIDTECGRCPLHQIHRDKAYMVGALRYGDHDYGMLSVALPEDRANDPEEQSLFKELIDDIAYALHDIELEEIRGRAEAEVKSLARFPAENPNPVLRISDSGNVLYANDAAREFVKAIGAADEESVNAEWREHIVEVLASGETKTIDVGFAEKIFTATLTPTGDQGYVNIYAQDITQRRKLQSQLHQSEKMESIGRLAGGVAHDFNNLLMGIMGYADLCLEGTADGGPLHEWIEEIIKGAKRSSNLTNQLLAFARKQTIAPEVIDLNDAVADMLKMLQRLIGEHIDLTWEPAHNIWPVKIDHGQLDQILANLCVNARDAIKGVGRITIETSNIEVDEAYCAENLESRPGDFVVLAVSDDGRGMNRETVAQIFEPFYTTKKSGAGTGLGLATIYGIVKQNNGFINVYSEPDEGTTFRIYIPRFEGKPAETIRSEESTRFRGGTETILLVEDEQSIRDTMRIYLERLGYTVYSAENPEIALRVADEYSAAIDLLLTDVVMPGMSGRDLAERLADGHPDLKVLYMSGYTANVIAHHGILEEGMHFMNKPIGRRELANKVREVLGS